MFSEAYVILFTIGLMATGSLPILVTARLIRILLECFLVDNNNFVIQAVLRDSIISLLSGAGQEISKLKIQLQEVIAGRSIAEDMNNALQVCLKDLVECQGFTHSLKKHVNCNFNYFDKRKRFCTHGIFRTR